MLTPASQHAVDPAQPNDGLVHKLFSRVRHNRLQEVTDILDAKVGHSISTPNDTIHTVRK